MKKVYFCKLNDEFYQTQQLAALGLGKRRQTVARYIDKGYIVKL